MTADAAADPDPGAVGRSGPGSGLRSRVADAVAASPRRPWLVLAAVLLGNFATGFTVTILAGSLPRIAGELGSDDATLVWAVTGPLLASGVCGPLFGKAGDLWGHRRVYLLGMIGAAAAALCSAGAWDAWSLIGFRVLGAIAGAALGPSSLALIFRVFPPEKRITAMGYWSLVGAGSPVIGVAVCGPMIEAGHWRWIFLVQVPLVLLALTVAALVVPESARGVRRRFDTPGAVTLAVATTSLLLALNRAPAWGWTDPRVLAAFAVAPLGAFLFVRIEQRAAHPMVPLSFLGRRNFTVPTVANLLLAFPYMGGFFMVPRLLQSSAFGYSVTHANLMSVARPLLLSITAPIASAITPRVGERRAVAAGSLAVGASMLSLAMLRPGVSDVLVFAAVGLSGVGMGMASPALSSSVANAVDESDLGIAGAAQQLSGQIGNVAGIQIMSTVQVASVAAGTLAAYGRAFGVGLVLALAAGLAGLFVRDAERPARPRS